MKFSDDFYKNAHGLVLAIALAITGIIVIAFVLLCGPAQACENVDCKPDAVREWNSDTSFVDWPCGRTDTVVTEPVIETLWGGSYAATAGLASELVSDDDTVIVPAIGIEELVDKIWDTTIISSDSLWVLGAMLMEINKRVQHPECWYVKSVDTTKEWLVIWYEGPSYGRPSDIIDTSWSDYSIDTTWAKKVSLGDVWLTPNQVLILKRLVGAVPPDTTKNQ